MDEDFEDEKQAPESESDSNTAVDDVGEDWVTRQGGGGGCLVPMVLGVTAICSLYALWRGSMSAISGGVTAWTR